MVSVDIKHTVYLPNILPFPDSQKDQNRWGHKLQSSQTPSTTYVLEIHGLQIGRTALSQWWHQQLLGLPAAKTSNIMTSMPAIQFWNSVPTVSVLSATTWSAYKDKQHHDPHASNPVLELCSHSLCSFSYNLVCIQRQTTPWPPCQQSSSGTLFPQSLFFQLQPGLHTKTNNTMTPMPAIQFWNSVPTVSVLSATTWSQTTPWPPCQQSSSGTLFPQSLFFQLQPGLHTKTNNTMTPMPAIQFWNSVPTVSVLSATTWSAYKDKQHHDPHASNPVLELCSHSLFLQPQPGLHSDLHWRDGGRAEGWVSCEAFNNNNNNKIIKVFIKCKPCL